jgi:hypothetical protein
MTRVRPRTFDSYRALQPRRSGKVLRGQRFGKASEGRRLNAAERKAVEADLRRQKVLQ